MAERSRKRARVAIAWRPFWRQFFITAAVTIAALWVAAALREAAIESSWLSLTTVMKLVVPALVLLLSIVCFGLFRPPKSRRKYLYVQRTRPMAFLRIVHTILGTLIALSCFLFTAVLAYSASIGDWLQFATILLAAIAALWVFFHDLVEVAKEKLELQPQEPPPEPADIPPAAAWSWDASIERAGEAAARWQEFLDKAKASEEGELVGSTILAGLHALMTVGILTALFFSITAVQPRTLEIGVSLPFGTVDGAENSLPLYRAIQQAYATFPKSPLYHVKLVPFDDADIDSKDCTEKGACPITILNPGQIAQIGQVINQTSTPSQATLSNIQNIIKGGRHEDFTDFANQPQLTAVIGPFNSGVAVREIPELSQLSIPLISPSNTSDCLTNPAFSNGDCNARKLDTGYYFRTATTDSIRQAAFARYIAGRFDFRSDQIEIFEQTGPKSSFFARSFASGFMQAWKAYVPTDTTQPGVTFVADASTVGELQDKLASLPSEPKAILYAGTGELSAKLYSAVMASDKQAVFLTSGSIENFINASNGASGNLYNIQPAALSAETIAQPPAVLNKLATPKPASALAYDTTNIVLQAIANEVGANGDFWNLRIIAWPNISRDLFTRFDTPFRQRVTKSISETNTGENRVAPTPPLTGVYSFNDDGDVDGAAGVTVDTFCVANEQWTTAASCPAIK